MTFEVPDKLYTEFREEKKSKEKKIMMYQLSIIHPSLFNQYYLYLKNII